MIRSFIIAVTAIFLFSGSLTAYAGGDDGTTVNPDSEQRQEK